MRQNLTGDFAARSKEAEREKLKTTPILQTQATILIGSHSKHAALRKSQQSLLPNTCLALGELPLHQGGSVPASWQPHRPWARLINGAGDPPTAEGPAQPLLALSNRVCWKELLLWPSQQKWSCTCLVGKLGSLLWSCQAPPGQAEAECPTEAVLSTSRMP